ncbi:polysaccharide lyase family 8 super-sandwich domain-containing protein [Nonomuraea dietziae]|uniref:polysaccharide lyase family 8 super-sandwich domain-containing protein n=1 Tax=Nonomuraea dietziae TaxID=65515 RepID=UPI003CD0756A
MGVHASDEITREYETVWFDHGAAPKQASYAYYVLPGSSAEETAELAARPEGAHRRQQRAGAVGDRGARRELQARRHLLELRHRRLHGQGLRPGRGRGCGRRARRWRWPSPTPPGARARRSWRSPAPAGR